MSAWVHAPPPITFTYILPRASSRRCSRHRGRPKVTPPLSMASSSSSLVRIAVVGDVHGYWNLEEDTKVLQLLQVNDDPEREKKNQIDDLTTILLENTADFQPDLVLFTGDFGEEDVELVESVAYLQFTKAVILGNHDSWYTQEFGRRQNGVQRQLEALGDEHVGYRRLDFPSLRLSVVGGRPFSHGGDRLFRKRLLVQRYGVHDMDISAGRIFKAALGTPEDHVVIVLAHNGPTDLAEAVWRMKERAKMCIQLVVFGHMHKELPSGGGDGKMMVVGADKTIYLNGAIVPRVKRWEDEDGERRKSLMSKQRERERERSRRAFTLVEIVDGEVEKIAETWVEVTGDMSKVVEEQILFTNGS